MNGLSFIGSSLIGLGLLALSACGSDKEDDPGAGGSGGSGGSLDVGTGGLDAGSGGNGGSRGGGLGEPIPPLSDFTDTEFGGYALGRELEADEELGGGSGSSGQADACGTVLVGVVRDFQDSHPDFEYEIADDRGLVQDEIGSDRKPVYAGDADEGTPTTNGQEGFDQWYRSVDGVNQAYLLFLNLVENGDVYSFSSAEFFPLDDAGFGNQDRAHNYHFTTELHTEFRYNGGETFSFVGDDDVWVFINGRLAIDLGGVHGEQTADIDLDDEAATLGLEQGQVYSLDMFHAERHTSESNFRIDTTLEFVNCGGTIVR